MKYDFRCEECGKVFEVSRPLSDEKAEACPKCASLKTHKVILQTPQLNVSWRNSLGLGHSGQISLSPVRNKALRGKGAVKHGSKVKVLL